MRTRRVLAVVAAVLALTLAPLDSARGQYADDWYEDAPPAEAYERTLAPYGGWVDGSPYGRVWVPRVGYGWRPYWDGQWAWSSWGWTWTSGEPWAWTYHYGRWSYAQPWGWVWVPGYTWGPAWVDWVWADGYVGWAPLGYGGYVPWSQWVFVQNRHFCNPRVRWNAVHWSRLPPRLRHGNGRWHHGGGRGPDREDIRRVAERPLRVYSGRERPRDSVAPWQRDGRGRRANEDGRGRGGDDDVRGPGRERDDDGRRRGRPRPDEGGGAARGDVERRGPDWRGTRSDVPRDGRGPGEDGRGRRYDDDRAGRPRDDDGRAARGRDADRGGRAHERERATSVPAFRDGGPASRWRAPEPPLPRGDGGRAVIERGGGSGRDGDGARSYGRGSPRGAAPRGDAGMRGGAPRGDGGMRGAAPRGDGGVRGGGAAGGQRGGGAPAGSGFRGGSAPSAGVPSAARSGGGGARGAGGGTRGGGSGHGAGGGFGGAR